MKYFHHYILAFFCVGTILICLTIMLQPVQARLQAVPQLAIDAYIEEQMQALQIPGVAVAVVKGDQVVHLRGYGSAGHAGRPVTAQTPFLIASLSKSFTALGVMQLVEAGKLNLDDPVQKYLSWFQVSNPDFSARITIRHLLYQTSGFSELEGYKRNLERNSEQNALEESIRRLRSSRLNAAPGDLFEYSNTNYDILGLLIQTVSGIPYATYIEENIFSPLQMQHSYTSLEKARVSGLSSGYSSFFGIPIEYDRIMPYSGAVVPSAGLFASAEDLASYLIVHLNEGRHPNGARILSVEGISELHKPGVNISETVGYAMGWTVFPFPQAAAAGQPGSPIPTGISHGGDWANFKALLLMLPDQKLGVAVLMNKNDYQQEEELAQLCWNTGLIALGLPPLILPDRGNFFLHDSRFVLVVILLLLAANFIWSATRLFPKTDRNQARYLKHQSLVFLILLPIVDLALAGYLFFFQLPQSKSTMLLALAFEPDIGLMYLLMLMFTLGWGTLRTVLAFIKVKTLTV